MLVFESQCAVSKIAVSKILIIHSPLLFMRARGRRVGQLEAPAGKYERSSQARFGGLTLVSRAPWLLVTGAPGLFSWPNTLWEKETF